MDAESVAAWIDERAAEHRFSGVAMVWRDGAPVFAHAAGLAHRGLRVPVRVDTRFAVASMAKMVTAATALRLVDRGVLDLHRPLAEALPREWQPVELTPAHTLHHLLSHTSGLGNYHDHDANTWESYTSCWDRLPTYHARGAADMLPLFVDAPSVAPPGTEFRYADANFLLVGLAVEAVTGRTFAACAADEVFGPAGMADSAFAQLDDEPSRLATGYLVTDAPPDAWRSNIYSVPAGGMPDGGLITTATDLARLIDALVGGTLLSPALNAAMTSPQGPNRDDLEQYGYGCELVVVDGVVTIIGHGGHDPGVSGLLTHYRADAVTTVVLCNHDRGSWAVCQRLAEALSIDDPRP